MGATRWRSEDSIVVLASYLARPPLMRRPPDEELQRVANLLRCPMEEVRRRMDGFAFLDKGTPDASPSSRDRKLFDRYCDDPAQCAMDAEWIIEGRKWRPSWLYGDP